MLLRLSLGFLEFPNKYIYPSPGSEEGKGRGVCAAFIHEKEPALTASHAVIYQLRQQPGLWKPTKLLQHRLSDVMENTTRE